MQESNTEKPGVQDWTGIMLALFFAGHLIYLAAHLVPLMTKMLEDFGSRQALPGATQMVVDHTWAPFLIAGASIAGVILLIVARRKQRITLNTSRVLLMVCIVATYVAKEFIAWAMFLPVLSLWAVVG